MTTFIYKLLRPLLFKINAETTHNLAIRFLKLRKNNKAPYTNDRLKVSFMGKVLNNPLGIAAGFDKYGTVYPYLSGFDFSFIELGSFTPQAQTGNPKPRLFRIVNNRALVNKMGFNNPGFISASNNVLVEFKNLSPEFQIAISLGKGKNTPNDQALDDYLEMIEILNAATKLKQRTTYIAINVSSPNTPGLRKLQTPDTIGNLFEAVSKYSEIPVFVKIAPDFDDSNEFQQTVGACLEAGVRGLIISNTSVDLSLLSKLSPSVKKIGGGLSGLPIRNLARKRLTEANSVINGAVPIIATGGVMAKTDLWDRLILGASLVQAYTGFIYGGPNFARASLEFLQAKMSEHGLQSVEELIHNRKKI